MTEFLHGYDKQAQAKEVTLHFQMYAREHVFIEWPSSGAEVSQEAH